MSISLRTSSTSGPIVATGGFIGIADNSTTPPTPPAPPTYSIAAVTNNPGFPTVIREGQYTATFTVTTTNVPNGTVLYWTTNGTGITAADFADNTLTGSVTINNNTATFSRSARADLLTEGSEVMSISLRTGSASGPIVATGGFIGITDTSTTPPLPPTYLITAVTTSPGGGIIREGQYTAIYTVTTTNVTNGTVLYWTTNGTGITAADFADNTLTGSITINNNTATFSRSARADLLTEGAEAMSISLRTGSASGPVVATGGFIGIADTSTTP